MVAHWRAGGELTPRVAPAAGPADGLSVSGEALVTTAARWPLRSPGASLGLNDESHITVDVFHLLCNLCLVRVTDVGRRSEEEE